MEISLGQPDEVFQVAPDPSLRHVQFASPERLTDSEYEDDSPSVIIYVEDIMEISSSLPKPLVNNYIPIRDQNENNNKNSEVKNIEIKPTPNLQSVNKDSDMDTPGNKK